VHELVYYKQRRRDGGIRIGLESEGATLFEDFEEGPEELQGDPLGAALDWYVDIRCRGTDLPTEADAARRWLLAREDRIRAGLLAFAEELAVGTDDEFPLRNVLFDDGPAAGRVEAVCSAVRRVTFGQLRAVLRDFAAGFAAELVRLDRPVTPAR
jgi:hypothetical protein